MIDRSRTGARSPTGPRRGECRGMVTAELAVGSIAVVIMVMLCLGIGMMIITQLRCVDVASEIARQAARGDDQAVAAARRTVPAGGTVDLRRGDGSVVVVVSAPVVLPPLPAVTVTGRAEAVVEPGA